MVTEEAVDTVVDECHEADIIPSMHCKEDRLHYRKFSRMLKFFKRHMCVSGETMRNCPVCTQE